MKTTEEVIIYTDGACLGNPGPGGWAAVLVYGEHRKEISGGFRLTTNNRMEITAAIEVFKILKTNKRRKVVLYSDSRLLTNAFNLGWIDRWQASGWMRNKREPVLNIDLWKRLVAAVAKHDVEFCWVEGHSGNIENELCDRLSKDAASKSGLPPDHGYESQIQKNTSVF
jgi:ribonuclease HI